MKVQAKLNVGNPGGGTAPKVKARDLTGKYTFPVQTLSWASTMTYTAECDQAFTANKVDYFDPMTLLFYVSCDGGSTWKYAGASGNQMYVTYATPIATVQLFHTILHLACSNPGATDGDSVIANVWQQFAGPANVKTWNDKDLSYYYTAGTQKTSTAAILADVEDDDIGDAQCHAFVQLMGDAVEANGVNTLWIVDLNAQNAVNFGIGQIDFDTTPTYPNETYYKYDESDLDFSPPNLPGQNTTPPQLKKFGKHYVLTNGYATTNFYDPSYGVVYSDVNDFISKIDGWQRNDNKWREAPGTNENILQGSEQYQ